MNKDQVTNLFRDFALSYDAEAKDRLWHEQSKTFRDFWASKVMRPSSKNLPDSEIDEIVMILDRHGKGVTKSSETVARVMIPQGAWRRMFNELKNSAKLSELLNQVFQSGPPQRADAIDELYKANEKNKNNLTGKSGNAVNAMLAAWDPRVNLSVVSLNDRRRVLEYFDGGWTSLERLTIGGQIVSSNDLILSGFARLGVTGSARTVSKFLYSSMVKPLWRTGDEEPGTEGRGDAEGDASLADVQGSEEAGERGLFYLEEELENFLIRNWDNTELGKKYELINEDGEMVSQQYMTPLGPIDILVQDKKTHQYVVIELKRNQSSDQTVGQLARYMGWLQQHKTEGKAPKGIIIAGKFDKKLFYALKMLQAAEVYLYQVDFKLNEFKEG